MELIKKYEQVKSIICKIDTNMFNFNYYYFNLKLLGTKLNFQVYKNIPIILKRSFPFFETPKLYNFEMKFLTIL